MSLVCSNSLHYIQWMSFQPGISHFGVCESDVFFYFGAIPDWRVLGLIARVTVCAGWDQGSPGSARATRFSGLENPTGEKPCENNSTRHDHT